MELKSASELLQELKAHIDKTYPAEKLCRGFIVAVAEQTSKSLIFEHLTNMADHLIEEYCLNYLAKAGRIHMTSGVKGEEKNELPRPERMHSDRCRTAIRSSKDSTDAN